MVWLKLISVFIPLPVMGQQNRVHLTGRVENSQHEKMAGVSVVLIQTGQGGVTASDGSFRLENIFPGSYSLRVSAIGYMPFSQKITVIANKDTHVEVLLQAETENLDEVSILGHTTNPDNLQRLERSAMPVQVITRRTIELMGSRRLDEVLKEQTGMTIVNDIGSGGRAVGLQMQGFSSQYIMILIDGQPAIGRNNGNFDLSRISVSNVERIEIVKGASSCLYGSSALGGAVNVITRQGANTAQARAAVFYGSYGLLDGALEGETPFAGKRGSANLSLNYYHTEGYNTNDRFLTSGKTIPPYDNYAVQGRFRYRLDKTSILGLQPRFNFRRSQMENTYISTGNGGAINNTNTDILNDKDLQLNVSLNSDFEGGLRSLGRYQFTYYDVTADVTREESNLSMMHFRELSNRYEHQLAYAYNRSLKFTAGLGGEVSRMQDATFGLQDIAPLYNGFGYIQGDWSVKNKWQLVGGLRYDHTGNYGGRLSPSFGVQYKIVPQLNLKGGIGGGFIAPDFKKRFQVFTNPTQGYTVIGADILQKGLEQMQQNGEISEIREYLVSQLSKQLKPERSNSFNAGADWAPTTEIKFGFSVFYHRLSNFINFVQVATKANGQQVFSYQNIASSYNKGLEASLLVALHKNMDLSVGYQYLITKDKGVLDSIRHKKYPYDKIRNSETGETRQSNVTDYFGLENRSRHMLNASIVYRYPAWQVSATLRGNYRSKYGWGDANNNWFLDPYDTFVKGFVLIYASLEKKLLEEHLAISISAENLFNYTDMLMPGQIGRVISGGLTYRFY